MKEKEVPVFSPEKIQILEFRLVHGHVECPFEFSSNEIDDFQSKLHFDMAFNRDNKLVKAELKVEVITHSKGTIFNEAKCDFTLVFLYRVENLDELLLQSSPKEDFQVDNNLANAISSITYSTSRGILIARLQGTAFKDFMLPVIPPNSLLNSPSL